MENISGSSIIKRNNDQIFSEIDGEIVMLSIQNGEYYYLNSVASEIWNHLKQSRTFSSLISILKENYEISEIECKQDTKYLLTELISKGLIIIDEETT